MSAHSDLVAGVIAGDNRAIARLITQAERGDPAYRSAFGELYAHQLDPHIIGVTGPPGSGKSTLVATLTAELRRQDQTVAILAVDPTSPYSGGAILGDRIRMLDVGDDDGVFIRSMASRGALGGIARATADAVDIVGAAGFDVVIVETVGVGQGEIEIVRAAHTTVVVSVPGLGDSIQNLKAGVLEIADIHVVNKSDLPNADRTVADLRDMLRLVDDHDEAWRPPIVVTNAISGDGNETLVESLSDHRRWLLGSGAIDAKREEIARHRLRSLLISEMLKSAQEGRLAGRMQSAVEDVVARRTDPYTAVVDLLDGIVPDH